VEQVRAFEVCGPGNRHVVIRHAGPDDASKLAALFDGLTADDRQRRFFQQYHPQPDFIERLVTAGERGGAGFVAVAIDDNGLERQLLGEAGFVLVPDGNGEVAMTLTPGGRDWLGPFLLDAVCEAAAVEGVANLESDVLTTDRAMLALLRSRRSVNMEHTGWRVVRVLVGTSKSGPSWPRRHDHLRVLVETPGGRWHAEADAHTAGLQVLTCSGPGTPPCPALVGDQCALADAADSIIVARPRHDESWQQLLESHAVARPDVAVCLEPPPVEDALVERTSAAWANRA